MKTIRTMTTTIIFIITIIFMVACSSTVSTQYETTDDSKKESLYSDDLLITFDHCEETYSGVGYEVFYKVQNNTDEQLSFVSISIVFIDADGTVMKEKHPQYNQILNPGKAVMLDGIVLKEDIEQGDIVAFEVNGFSYRTASDGSFFSKHIKPITMPLELS
jgi:hypothetical protein